MSGPYEFPLFRNDENITNGFLAKKRKFRLKIINFSEFEPPLHFSGYGPDKFMTLQVENGSMGEVGPRCPIYRRPTTFFDTVVKPCRKRSLEFDKLDISVEPRPLRRFRLAWPRRRLHKVQGMGGISKCDDTGTVFSLAGFGSRSHNDGPELKLWTIWTIEKCFMIFEAKFLKSRS